MYFSRNPHSISIQSHFHPSSLTLPYVILPYPHFFIFSYFLLTSSYHSLLFSFSFSYHFITSHFTSSFSLSPLSYYSSILSNHISCLLSSSHLYHAHHLAYSSIIHPTSSSFHPPSIPSFSLFSLFHSFISPWCSSRFPQNSFSLISFIILSYSLFHPPFHPISPPSPSSPHIFAFHSHSHLCSLSIYFHLILPLSHFHHTHSYPFPFQSSHSISFHHSHSFPIHLLTPHSLTFSGTLLLHHRHSFISSIPIIIPLSSILHIPFMSFLRFSSSCLYYEFYTMFVRILVIACSFVVLIGNTLCQLDVSAFASDG